jgi:hypothetical protein
MDGLQENIWTPEKAYKTLRMNAHFSGKKSPSFLLFSQRGL